MAIDIVISMVIGIMFYLICFFIGVCDSLYLIIENNKNVIYPLISTIAGTLLGFILTGVSILIAFPDTPKIKTIKKSKQYPNIFKVYFNTIVVLAITSFLGIIGILVNKQYSTLIGIALLIAIIASSLRIQKCIWILESMIDIKRLDTS